MARQLFPAIELPVVSSTWGDYYYVVADVKFATLQLSADGQHLRNAGGFRAYKGQLWIYNEALAHMQKCKPESAFILGRRWKCPSKGSSSTSCLDKLGTISFSTYDKWVAEATEKAIRWRRDLERDGAGWDPMDPKRFELYPNMCRKDSGWEGVKADFADRHGEITQLWSCGYQNREVAWSNGIRSWKDPRASAATLGVSATRRVTVDSMIAVNKGRGPPVVPLRISASEEDWRAPANDVYLDFETMGDIFTDFADLPRQNYCSVIFQAGLGRVSSGGWTYRSYLSSDGSKLEERRILIELSRRVRRRRVFYWHAEKVILARALRDHPDLARLFDTSAWVDLRRVLVVGKVAIRGCFSYSLKDVGRALKGLGRISTHMCNVCESGTSAMLGAHQAYRSTPEVKEQHLREIESYNEVDCRLLHDILTYFRTNH